MRGRISTLLEIILLIVTVGFFSVFIGLKLKPGNLIDKIFRPLILTSEKGRRIFVLDNLGDYRFAITRAKSISLDIFELEPNILQASDYEISKTLSDNLKFTPVHVAKRTVLTSEYDIKQIYRTYRFQKAYPGQAKIIIFVEGTSALAPTNIGETYQDQGIIVYAGRVMELTKRTDSQKKLEISTILHELGHQMGLEHVARPECIMADTVEVGDWSSYQQIAVDFCPTELQQIKW